MTSGRHQAAHGDDVADIDQSVDRRNWSPRNTRRAMASTEERYSLGFAPKTR